MIDKCAAAIKLTKLQIHKDVCAALNAYSTSYTQGSEIEVRFNFKDETGPSHSGIGGREKWVLLMDMLSTCAEYTRSEPEKTLVDSYGNIRKITNLSSNIPVMYEEKKRIGVVQLLQFKIGTTTYTVTCTNSTEKIRNDFKEATDSSPDFTRERTRVSFLHSSKKYRIDMTYAINKKTQETAYEAEIEYLAKSTLQEMIDPVKIIVSAIKDGDSNELITVTEHDNIIQVYNKFFDGERFDKTKFYRKALPQPINLKRKYVADMSAYAVTNKLNGTRVVGLIHEGDLYTINMIGNVTKISGGMSKTNNNTLFDAELFEGKIYAFDMLFFRKMDVRNKNLDVRTQYISELISTKPESSYIQIKKHEMNGDIAVSVRTMLDYIHTFDPSKNDGLIFTPITSAYNSKNIYKWKPPNELTIDFLAVSLGDNKYALQVKDKRNANVTFAPNGFSGFITSTSPQEGVGEYAWQNDTFVRVRNRPDKDAPNYIDIANDVWEDIINPLIEEELRIIFVGTDAVRDAVRKLHNTYKRDLILKYFNRKVVTLHRDVNGIEVAVPNPRGDERSGMIIADIGSGRGGDLAKFNEAKVRKVYAIEPNTDNIAEMVKRVKTLEAQHKLNFDLVPITAKAQDVAVITQNMKNVRVDGVSAFFMLTFLYQDAIVFDNFKKLLSQISDENTLFIGTVMDGDRVRELLSKQSKVTLGPVIIEKMYNDGKDVKYQQFGNAIKFKYENSATVWETQVEYLVDFGYFKHDMESIGFELVHTALFPAVEYLTEEQNTLTQLNREFVFRKVKKSNAAIELFNEQLPKHLEKPLLHAEPTKTSTIQLLFGNNLVRTGTPKVQNSFMYAIYTALNPKFRMMNVDDQTKYVENNKLTISEDDWFKNRISARTGDRGIDAEIIARLRTLEQGQYSTFDLIKLNLGYKLGNLIEIIVDKYQQISKLDCQEYVNKLILDLQIIMLPPIEDRKRYLKPGEDDNIMTQIGLYDVEVQNKIKETVEVFTRLINESRKAAYNFFAANLSKGIIIPNMISVIGDVLNKNIIVASATKKAIITKEPLVAGRKIIYLLKFDDDHYECIGVVKKADGNTTVTREFDVIIPDA